MSGEKKLWEGGASGAFKVFNWELFVKPRKWIMYSGLVFITVAMGNIAYSVYTAQNQQLQSTEEKKKILQYAEEIKRQREKN